MSTLAKSMPKDDAASEEASAMKSWLRPPRRIGTIDGDRVGMSVLDSGSSERLSSLWVQRRIPTPSANLGESFGIGLPAVELFNKKT